MEDTLDVYHRPYDARRPQVCMDETSRQLVGETRTPVPVQPGRPARFDYEYVRHGVRNLFLWVEPLAGRRHVQVTHRRTKQDWTRFIRDLLDVHYPAAEAVVLVLDNLNTHVPAALSDTFPPGEARRLLDRLELHYTPKHGSWLNMAEIELSVLARQGLTRRIPDADTLTREVAAGEKPVASRKVGKSAVAWSHLYGSTGRQQGGSWLLGWRAEPGERFDTEVAATGLPLVMLLAQDGPDQPDDGPCIGEEADHIATPLDLLVPSLDGVVARHHSGAPRR
jgi:hypothetical protein